MRAAVVQMRSSIDRERNLAEAEELIREAASQGAEFISTPEMTTVLDQDRKRLMKTLEARDPDPEGFFCKLSAELGVLLHIGSMPLYSQNPERLRNRSLLIDGGELVATYDKVHLFDADLPDGESWRESALYEHGEEAVLAHARGVAFGLTVCFDLRFGTLYRDLGQAGAQVLTVPSAFTTSTGKAHWHVLLRARAIETGSYVVAAAQGGEHEDGRRTFGHSLIVSPWGDVIAEVDHDRPGVALAEMDMQNVADMRQRLPSLKLERHPELRIYGA
ncbi:carbon-nitrogen hydrolase family protein [Parvularcula maris]|uniref:Carbon-nitrogen hydrolase family protein n=1 Tax=Parvularcula maris TaxID=2965077 RepID=A0A9X2RHT1_9PROT|nr:carbon-nitrogen hydrolase family protein [Parvularcula maris]